MQRRTDRQADRQADPRTHTQTDRDTVRNQCSTASAISASKIIISVIKLCGGVYLLSRIAIRLGIAVICNCRRDVDRNSSCSWCIQLHSHKPICRCLAILDTVRCPSVNKPRKLVYNDSNSDLIQLSDMPKIKRSHSLITKCNLTFKLNNMQKFHNTGNAMQQ